MLAETVEAGKKVLHDQNGLFFFLLLWWLSHVFVCIFKLEIQKCILNVFIHICRSYIYIFMYILFFLFVDIFWISDGLHEYIVP